MSIDPMQKNKQCVGLSTNRNNVSSFKSITGKCASIAVTGNTLFVVEKVPLWQKINAFFDTTLNFLRSSYGPQPTLHIHRTHKLSRNNIIGDSTISLGMLNLEISTRI